MKKLLFPILLVASGVAPAVAQMSVTLTPSVPSPARLGTVVQWTATASNASSGTLHYRFQTRYAGWGNRITVTRGVNLPEHKGGRPERTGIHAGMIAPTASDFHTVVDFGPNATFNWSTIAQEGLYEIQVTVENQGTGEVASGSALYLLTPIATGTSAMITPTAHPLVFIYSAPACPLGSRMKVQIQAPEGTIQNTPYQDCLPGLTMNFYLAGMRQNSQYLAGHVVVTGIVYNFAPQLSLTTGLSAMQPPISQTLTSGQPPATNGILLQSLIQNNATATDLYGNLVWYGPPEISFVTRPVSGGTFMGTYEDGGKDPSYQVMREFDLALNTVCETNAARVNEQLAAMGMHAINSFHHEARKLPKGGYLVLADSERILTDVQGPGPVDVIGDTILVLDANLQVTWAWDTFDHLDTSRKAVLGETCTYPANLGCAPFYLSPHANDWLHGNALQLTPDGNILYSVRHQDWIIKIDYENGAGSGNILWRLGSGGDFQINSTDPSPWFSHQHDANILTNGNLLVFDDGNTRVAAHPGEHSRGQALQLDEQKLQATLVLNADLGTYSYALGSAQQLPDGNYHFDSGAAPSPSHNGSFTAHSVEVDPAGSVVYDIQFGALEYRSFRMQDLYTAP